MWNAEKSVTLSKFSVIFCIALLVAAAIFVPFIGNALSNANAAGWFALHWHGYFLITCYVGLIPSGALLITLLRLLIRLERGSVFTAKNVAALRVISWYCFAGALLSAVSAAYYVPWVFVAAAAAFMGLIVRVVKNIFSRAVALQNDADFTI